MADALLGTVIENLASFVQQELATFWNVEEQIHTLSGYLTTIRVVLKDAEEKQITDPAVRLWLQKLSDAAHVLEDILDECSIIESNHSVCITRFTPQRILSRYDIGKRMKKVADKFDVIAQERRKFELHGGMAEKKPEDDEWRQTSSVGAASKVYGRDGDRERIVEILLTHACDSEEISIYSIVGLGGHGKTTLAQLVYHDERVTQHFIDLKIWVCVSEVFSMTRILQSIVESVTGQNPNLTSLESMQKKVEELLKNKRYLLVLDDVWNEDQVKWDKLKYFLQRVTGKKGASILVTTRLGTVASIVGTYPAHHLEGLSENDIWSLFKQQAFGSSDAEQHSELEAIGKEIVKKCVGSPLAVKVLGSLLRDNTDEHKWLSVKESKFWDLTDDDQYSPIMCALRLSYFNLKLSLRRCFSFCAIFPKDFEMAKERLIHLWMANGFITCRGNLEVEHVGNEVWNALHQRSFFQQVETDEFGNVKFKMHDLVHDLAQSIIGDECVVSSATSLSNLPSRVHHIGCLCFRERFKYNKIPFKKVESLRTFLEFDMNWDNFRTLPSIKPLRALCTSSSQLSALKNLTHLRYLELCHSWITTLPESICGLHRLQTLKLKHCDCLTSLPNQLTQLQDLRHLMIKDCDSLVGMPFKIGKLNRLRTLSLYIVGSKEGTGLAELRDLQLGGKLHIKGLEKVSSEQDAKNTNLIAKKDLNRLYLTWGGCPNSQGASPTIDAERVLEVLKPHSNLRSFGMSGYRGIRIPNWMGNLKCLVHVILMDCKNFQRLPPLGKLPCLTTLYASGMNDVKYIDDDAYDAVAEKAFPSLKKLTLNGLLDLERMLEAQGVEMLPQLSEIIISGTPKLTLPCLPSVKELAVSESSSILLGGGVLRNMNCLTKLSIEYLFNLETLPDELGSLSALEELRIESCYELESFPEHVMQGLSSLRYLSVTFCPKLKSLSQGFGHLTRLEHLEIHGCSQLVALPSNMNQLTALHTVHIIGSDESNALPEGLERIPCLQTLAVLSCHGLTSLPDSLGAILSLQSLIINDCPNLTSLPDWLQQHSNLKSLVIVVCPKLEKRCKQATGEDWQKIAHIPQFELKTDSDEQSNICDDIRMIWKIGKQLLRIYRHNYTFNPKFDRMVDKL